MKISPRKTAVYAHTQIEGVHLALAATCQRFISQSSSGINCGQIVNDYLPAVRSYHQAFVAIDGSLSASQRTALGRYAASINGLTANQWLQVYDDIIVSTADLLTSLVATVPSSFLSIDSVTGVYTYALPSAPSIAAAQTSATAILDEIEV